jgi:PadR family transcriptional regulator, regulatory protein AphA
MSPLVRQPLTIEYALLGFLHAGPLHGYEIHRRLADRAGLGRVWRLKQSHLYALLARLEAEGLIASRREPQATRPTRRVFALTEAGRQALAEWVQSPVARGREVRLDFLAKLYCARAFGPVVVTQLVARQRAALEGWLAEVRGPAPAALAPEDALFARLVADFRAGQIEAMLAWLAQVERALVAA